MMALDTSSSCTGFGPFVLPTPLISRFCQRAGPVTSGSASIDTIYHRNPLRRAGMTSELLSRVGCMTAAQLRNFINGEYVEARAESSFDVIDPVTEGTYASSPVSSPADVDAAYQAAATAFET